MKERRNISPGLLRDLRIENISTIAKEEPAQGFVALEEELSKTKPKTSAPPMAVSKTISLDDEQIYAAAHPGDLQRLGFDFYEWTNDVSVGLAPFVNPLTVLQVEIKQNDTLVLVDWRNFAHKNIGGNLVIMTPGELDDSNFSVLLSKKGRGSGIGVYAYGSGVPRFDSNAVGRLDQSTTFLWPGKFRYIIRGPELIKVQIRYLAPALPPYSVPAVFASTLIGYYRQG